jgi:hypothetical protein
MHNAKHPARESVRANKKKRLWLFWKLEPRNPAAAIDPAAFDLSAMAFKVNRRTGPCSSLRIEFRLGLSTAS